MKTIHILGTGCPKCTKLMENAEKAANEFSGEFQVKKVDDINDIMSFGVMMTPALAIEKDVKSVGKLLSVDEIKAMLS